MKWITGKLPFSYWTLLIFAVPLLIWVLVSVATVMLLRESQDISENLAAGEEAILLASEYRNVMSDARQAEQIYLITFAEDAIDAHRGAIQRANRAHSELLWRNRGESMQIERLERAGEAIQEWFYDVSLPRMKARTRAPETDDENNRAISGADEAADSGAVADDGSALVQEFQETMNNFILSEQQELQRYRREASSIVRSIEWIVWGGLGVGIVLKIFAVFWMTRRIGRSVESIDQATDQLSRGNWGARARRTGKSDELAERFNLMAELVERRNHQTALLAELGEMLHSCNTITEAMRVFGQFAEKLFPDQAGVLYLVEPNRTDVTAVACWLNGDAHSDKHMRHEDCWALRLGRVHENEPDGKVRCDHVPPKGVNSRCVPLPAFGEIIGMIFVTEQAGEGKSDHTDKEQQKQFADNVAEQVALAFANVKLREKLRNQSIRDPLTQLYNRRHLDEVFQRELYRAERHNEPLAVLTFDLDHFKDFNDAHGHDGGDAILRCIADTLRDFFRPEDGAFRAGGEEFVTLLPGTGVEDATARADELRKEVADLTVMHEGAALPKVTISVGVACYPVNGKDPDRLLKAADLALYKAKELGRNRVATAESRQA